MEIGVHVNFRAPDNMDEGFAILHKNGIHSCQLCSWIPALWTEENASMIRALAEKYGVRISAFWCGWEGPRVWNFYDGPVTLGLVPVEYRAMRVKNLCDGADFAKLLGVTGVSIWRLGTVPMDSSWNWAFLLPN